MKKQSSSFTYVAVSLLALIAIVLAVPKSDPVERVAAEATPKTVSIKVSGVVHLILFDLDLGTHAYRVGGAGVFITPNGHILTCDHLFSMGGIEKIEVTTWGGQVYEAVLLYREQGNDLALLSTYPDKPVKFAKLANPHSLVVGQAVIAIGSPLGLPFTVTHGILSALNRDGMGVYNMTQSDTSINPGNSGGPLFNLKGELVGINSRVRPPIDAPVFTGLGFSVSPGQIIEFLTRFRGLEKAIR